MYVIRTLDLKDILGISLSKRTFVTWLKLIVNLAQVARDNFSRGLFYALTEHKTENNYLKFFKLVSIYRWKNNKKKLRL